jgi:hypothetical protein
MKEKRKMKKRRQDVAGTESDTDSDESQGGWESDPETKTAFSFAVPDPYTSKNQYVINCPVAFLFQPRIDEHMFPKSDSPRDKMQKLMKKLEGGQRA